MGGCGGEAKNRTDEGRRAARKTAPTPAFTVEGHHQGQKNTGHHQKGSQVETSTSPRTEEQRRKNTTAIPTGTAGTDRKMETRKDYRRESSRQGNTLSIIPSRSKAEDQMVLRSEVPQQVHSVTVFQDGDDRRHQTSDAVQSMDDIHRHHECVPPRADIQETPKISEIQGGQENLSLPMHAVRHFERPVSAASTAQSSDEVHAVEGRDQSLFLCGRLPVLGRHTGEVQRGHEQSSQDLRGTGLDSQSRKIVPRTATEASTSGVQPRHSQRPDIPSDRQVGRHQEGGDRFAERRQMLAQTAGGDTRKDDRRLPSHAVVTQMATRNSSMPQQRTQKRHQVVRKDQTRREGESRPYFMVKACQKNQRNKAKNSRTVSDHHNRRVPHGMGGHISSQSEGGPDTRRDDRGLLDRTGNGIELEHQGASRGFVRASILQASHSEELISSDSNGQHDSSVILEQTRRTHPTPERFDISDSEDYLHKTSPVQGHSHPRSSEPDSGPAITIEEEGSRLDDSSESYSIPPGGPREVHGRPVREPHELSLSPIRIMETGPNRSAHGRLPSRFTARECFSSPSHSASSSICASPISFGLSSAMHSRSSIMEGDSLAFNITPDFNERRASDSAQSDSRESNTSRTQGSTSTRRRGRPPIRSLLDPETSEFILSSRSENYQRVLRKDYNDFIEWLKKETFSVNDIIYYIRREILPKTTAAATALRILASINIHSLLKGGPEITKDPQVQAFRRALKKHRPTGATEQQNPTDTYDPTLVLARALADDFTELKTLRKQVIVILRTIALMRSGDCANIIRSSLTVTKAMNGTTVLSFKYIGKTARLSGRSYDMNYIERLADAKRYPYPFQPVELILLYCSKIEDKVGRKHDRLLSSVKYPYRPLVSVSIARISMQALKEAGIQDYFKARSLRAMVSEYLSLKGIPEDQIDKRGGWSSRKNIHSATRSIFYRTRAVHTNFTQVLCDSALKHRF